MKRLAFIWADGFGKKYAGNGAACIHRNKRLM
jgi:hypothetical protein